MKVDFFKFTDKGARGYNQDRIEAVYTGHTFFACVADGVGGSNCGDIAAQESVISFLNSLSAGNEDLAEIMEIANLHLKQLQEENPECMGMATTFTGCTIQDDKLNMVHAGDSRLCVLREGSLVQLSDNHTEVELLLRTGQLTPEEAEFYPRRNVILSALGIYGQPIIQSTEFQLQGGDRILLTSDGIHEVISKPEFIELSLATGDIHELGTQILDLLSTKVITDNVSLVAISVD